MPNSSNSLSAMLLGTNTDKRWTVLLHVFFWVAAYWWFKAEGAWLSDPAHPRATWLMTAHAGLTVLVTFYVISYFVKRLENRALVWLWVVLLLLVSFFLYCLTNYYLYRYIDAAYPDVPIYLHRVTKNISKQGPWTFLENDGILYYHANRYVLISFLPFAIKGVRSLVQSRVKALALEKDNLKLELEFLRAQITRTF